MMRNQHNHYYHRYRARVTYDGTHFRGFQVQEKSQQPRSRPRPPQHPEEDSEDPEEGDPEDREDRPRKPQRTVQGVLEKALSTYLQQQVQQQQQEQQQQQHSQKSQSPPPPSTLIRIVAASRTDAGVHARGQAIMFDLPPIPPLMDKNRRILKKEEPYGGGGEHHAFFEDADFDSAAVLDDDVGHHHHHQQQLLEYHWNRLLPPDVKVFHVQRVALCSSEMRPSIPLSPPPSLSSSSSISSGLRGWNVMKDCVGKRYSYYLHMVCCGNQKNHHHHHHGPNHDATTSHSSNRTTTKMTNMMHPMHPMHRFTRWQYPYAHTNVNVSVLHDVLKQFEGTHDFRAFAGQVEQQTAKKKKQKQTKKLNLSTCTSTNININTVRTVYSVRLVQDDHSNDDPGNNDNDCGSYYRIDFDLQGALYKQVRNMVGTALDVARGEVSRAHFTYLLSSSSNGNAGGDGDGDGDGHNNHHHAHRHIATATRKDNRSKPAPAHGLVLETVYFNDTQALSTGF